MELFGRGTGIAGISLLSSSILSLEVENQDSPFALSIAKADYDLDQPVRCVVQ
jgi:hypothetical protein